MELFLQTSIWMNYHVFLLPISFKWQRRTRRKTSIRSKLPSVQWLGQTFRRSMLWMISKRIVKWTFEGGRKGGTASEDEFLQGMTSSFSIATFIDHQWDVSRLGFHWEQYRFATERGESGIRKKHQAFQSILVSFAPQITRLGIFGKTSFQRQSFKLFSSDLWRNLHDFW